MFIIVRTNQISIVRAGRMHACSIKLVPKMCVSVRTRGMRMFMFWLYLFSIFTRAEWRGSSMIHDLQRYVYKHILKTKYSHRNSLLIALTLASHHRSIGNRPMGVYHHHDAHFIPFSSPSMRRRKGKQSLECWSVFIYNSNILYRRVYHLLYPSMC